MQSQPPLHHCFAFTAPLPLTSLTHQCHPLTIPTHRPRISAVQLPDPPSKPSPETQFKKNLLSGNTPTENTIPSPYTNTSSSPYSFKIPVTPSDDIQRDKIENISIQNDIPSSVNLTPIHTKTDDNQNTQLITLLRALLLGPSLQGQALRVTTAALSSFFLLSQFSNQFPDVLDISAITHTLLTALISFTQGPHFAVSLGMGVSALIQALTGFGFAIVSVGALTQVPWIANSSVFNTIQPVAATLGAFTGWVLLFPELKKVCWKNIATLLIASTIATPIGAVLLETLDSGLIIRSLGALISGYVLYGLFGIKVPKQLGSNNGAWGLGFLAGALGGAFDITGPPLVIHGEAAEWSSDNGEFKRNVLAVVTVNSTLVVLYDLLIGRLNDFYYFDFISWAFPPTILGIIVGKIMADRLNPNTFKKIVLATCMFMGVRLLFN